MVEITEAQLKQGIIEYLQYGMNQLKWWFTRLNSGQAFVKRGNKYYAIQLSDAGTADLLVIKRREFSYGRPRVIFIELKSRRGKTSPDQDAFKVLVESQGASYAVVRSLEELQEIIG